MLITRNTIVLTFLFSFILTSCGSNPAENQLPEGANPDEIRMLDPDDERVAVAYEQAQQELNAMEIYFKDDAAGIYQIYVKVKFTENEQVEHMWGTILAINADTYSIRLDNEPVYVQNVVYGDTLNIDKTEVEDFLVYEGEVVVLGDFMNW
ncbi:MAG: hypothetical protein ACI8ZM_005023 [Crocinitomix sp.]|jgi:uncharacterized protein YegJ (DUF2314 family)